MRERERDNGRERERIRCMRKWESEGRKKKYKQMHSIDWLGGYNGTKKDNRKRIKFEAESV